MVVECTLGFVGLAPCKPPFGEEFCFFSRIAVAAATAVEVSYIRG
jgi:hypothetical protein